MKIFICFIFFFSFVLSGEETLFLQFNDLAKSFVKSEFGDCAINDFYKIPRSSFYAIHTSDKDKSLNCFNKSSAVKRVFADKRLNLSYKSKGDPYLKNQWHLQNTGQTGVAGNDAKVVEAWKYLKELGLSLGKGIKVGIIDDAFDLNHPDMAGKFLTGYDLIDKDYRPYADDNEPHGSCVAGVVAAVKDNGIGVAGACPECKIVPVRSGSKLGEGENMAAAFNYLLDRGVQIISNSWGPNDNGGAVEMPEIIQEIVQYAKEKERGGKGVLIFFAAGNGNESISDEKSFDGFAANRNVIAVGACNASGTRSVYSDFGKDLDIMAPSSDTDSGYVWNPFAVDSIKDGIWTTDARSYYGYSQTDYTGTFGGTSSATPLVAGIAALLLSAYPDLSWDEFYEIVAKSADKIAPTDAEYDESGFSEKYGYGRIDALAALKMLCERRECLGGLPEIDEESYPAEDLDCELNDSDWEDFPDDSMLPLKIRERGCALIFL